MSDQSSPALLKKLRQLIDSIPEPQDFEDASDDGEWRGMAVATVKRSGGTVAAERLKTILDRRGSVAGERTHSDARAILFEELHSLIPLEDPTPKSGTQAEGVALVSPDAPAAGMKLRDLRSRVLRGLYDLAGGRTGAGAATGPQEIAEAAGLDPNDPKLETAIESLHERGLLNMRRLAGGAQFIARVFLTPDGVDAVEAAEQEAAVPASDRYVSRSDNGEAFDRLTDAVSDLVEEFRKHNERTPELDTATAELRSFQAAIEAPHVNVDLADRAIKSAGKWVSMTSVEAIVGHLAVAAFLKLMELWAPIAAAALGR